MEWGKETKFKLHAFHNRGIITNIQKSLGVYQSNSYVANMSKTDSECKGITYINLFNLLFKNISSQLNHPYVLSFKFLTRNLLFFHVISHFIHLNHYYYCCCYCYYYFQCWVLNSRPHALPFAKLLLMLFVCLLVVLGFELWASHL